MNTMNNMNTMNKVYYLASPYSHSDPSVQEYRYLKVMSCTKQLLDKNVYTFSPILYCHEMCKIHNLPSDAEWWWKFNKSFIDKFKRVIVYTIDGWKESSGVTQEIQYANTMKYNIHYYNDIKTKE